HIRKAFNMDSPERSFFEANGLRDNLNSFLSKNELRQVKTFKNAPPISRKGVFLLFKLSR
ncbi:hypothetical protein CGH75_24860, partial [Vibrio parahaemolyticus]